MHTALQRLDTNRVRVRTPYDIDITLFANDRVFLDPVSIDEIVAFAALSQTLAALNATGFLGDAPARIDCRRSEPGGGRPLSDRSEFRWYHPDE
jgi:hypothetical protein